MEEEICFVGNQHAKQDLVLWLKNYVNTPYLSSASCVLISGPNGVGKTTLVKYACSISNYYIHWITPDTCESGKILQDMVRKFTQSTIDTAWANQGMKTVIVIDALDIMIANDRNFFIALQQIILKNTTIPGKPIICICEPALVKKIVDNKVCNTIIKLKSIPGADLCIYLKNEFPTIHASTITKIVDACDGNLVQARELALYESNHTISKKILDVNTHLNALTVQTKKRGRKPKSDNTINQNSNTEIINKVCIKDMNQDFKIDKLPDINELYVPKSLPEWIKLFSLEPWMHPLRFHENFIKELENCKKSKAEKTVLYHELLSDLIQWDTHMGFLLDSGLEGTITELPIELFSMQVQQILDRAPRHYPLKHPDETLSDFTKLLSQLSLQKKFCQNYYDTYQGDNFPINEFPYYWFTSTNTH